MKRARLLITLVFFTALPAAAEPPATATNSIAVQVVDAFTALYGAHPGARVNHAKGVVVKGSFTASATAADVSTAVHFQAGQGAIPLIIRFSDAGGLPTVADSKAIPRGMAMKFTLADGTTTDIVLLSYNGFPVATAQDFRDFLLAIHNSGPDSPKPTPLDDFLGKHPAAKAFVSASNRQPVSFASLTYYGINTFKFTNNKGEVTYGRYQLQPAGGPQYLSEDRLAKAGPDYLMDEIADRIAHGPSEFKLVLQLAAAGDKLDDPSVAWPDSRPTVELGTVAITETTQESHTADKLLFLPNHVVPGIEPADPMIAVRSAAYPISFARRLQSQAADK